MQILGAVCIIGGAMIGELIKTKKKNILFNKYAVSFYSLISLFSMKKRLQLY